MESYITFCHRVKKPRPLQQLQLLQNNLHQTLEKFYLTYLTFAFDQDSNSQCIPFPRHFLDIPQISKKQPKPQ